MSTAVADRLTLAEFSELPEDPHIDRMLLFGELVERPMTMRNHWHAETEAVVSKLLGNWRDSRGKSLGKVFSGEIGCELPEVESSFGIDVAYFDQATLDRQDPKAKYIVGPPVLAVEILSPSDVIDDIHRKIRAYLQSGVRLVWVIDPLFQTLTVHRGDARPEMYSSDQEVSGDPHLPGLAFRVQELFE